VPFIRIRRTRSVDGTSRSATSTDHGAALVGEPALADQAVPVPLPRRRPGSHGAPVVKADPAAADLATLRKVVDGLNRI
jgi:hypothetical protein